MDTVEEVISKYGGPSAVQARFKYATLAGVCIWRVRGLPKKHLVDIHYDTGIDLKRLQKATNLSK